MRLPSIRALAGGLLAAAAASTIAVTAPETYVTTLSGTNSRYDLSRGNLLPLVARPWGAAAWAPQTDNDPTWSSWWFHPTDVRFFGVRLTRQPSPWISDYGNVRIAATVTDPSHADPWQFSSYDPAASSWLPHYFNASLLTYGTNGAGFVTVELTATNHSSMLRLRYPPYISTPTSTGYNQTRRVLLALNNVLLDQIALNSVTQASMAGFTVANSGGVPANFRAYVVATVESEASPGAVPRVVGQAVVNDGSNIYAYIDFDPTDPLSDSLIVRVGTSLISLQQAQLNLATEVGGRTFADVLTESQLAWRSTLSAIDVGDVGAGYTPQAAADALQVSGRRHRRGSLRGWGLTS